MSLRANLTESAQLCASAAEGCGCIDLVSRGLTLGGIAACGVGHVACCFQLLSQGPWNSQRKVMTVYASRGISVVVGGESRCFGSCPVPQSNRLSN